MIGLQRVSQVGCPKDERGREQIQAEIDQVHGPGKSTMGRECGQRFAENAQPEAGGRRVERDQNSRASQEEKPLAEQSQVKAAWPDDRQAHHPIELFRGETIGKLFLNGTVRELAGSERDQQGRSKGGVSLFVVFAATVLPPARRNSGQTAPRCAAARR